MSDHSDTEKLDKYGGRSVHISKVEELVSTGDIIMFKSRNSLSGLQRIATGTNWDHVGMVLKRGKKICDLLEATGDGVHMYPLAQRLEVYSRTLMSEICVRQLQGNVSVNLTKMVEDFFDKVEGKPYELTTKKILFKEGCEDYEDRSGFFCSELVAAAYEECGLLNVEKDNVNRFWPVAFSPSGYFERSLNSSYELGPVILIDCNKAEIGNARRMVSSGCRRKTNFYKSSFKNESSTAAALSKNSNLSEAPSGTE